MKRILIFEDDLDLGAHWKSELETAGFAVVHFVQFDPIVEYLTRESVDLIITDMLIGSASSGFEKKGTASASGRCQPAGSLLRSCNSSCTGRPSPSALLFDRVL